MDTSSYLPPTIDPCHCGLGFTISKNPLLYPSHIALDYKGGLLENLAIFPFFIFFANKVSILPDYETTASPSIGKASLQKRAEYREPFGTVFYA
jgi:hypothetical protein